MDRHLRVAASANDPVCIVWRAVRPALVADGLAAAGLAFDTTPGGRGYAVRLGADALVITGWPARLAGSEGGGGDRIELTGRSSLPAGRSSLPAGPLAGDRPTMSDRLVAIGLATVDAERSALQHGLGALEPAGEDTLLGARAWTIGGPGRRLLLLEPSTEGRLAGWLARAGEGYAAIYLDRGASSSEEPQARSSFTDHRSIAPRARRGRIIARGQPSGPFLILLDGPPDHQRSRRTTSSSGRRPPARGSRASSPAEAG